MVHRESADHHIERPIGEGEVTNITDLERQSAFVDGIRASDVGLRLGNHRWVEVDRCYVEFMPVGKSNRQVTGSAPHLEDPRLSTDGLGDIIGDPIVERGE